MHATRTWIAFITAGCLTACHALGPAISPATLGPSQADPAVSTTRATSDHVDLGAKTGAAVTITINPAQGFGTKGAPPLPAAYLFELRDAGTNAVVASNYWGSASITFTNVPGGTYYARIDAVDGALASIVVGGAQTSLPNQVVVTGGSATYTTGFSLSAALTLKNGTGGSVAANVTNPYPGAVGELINPTNGALLTGGFYTSGSPNFHLQQVVDGTYGFWGFGLSGGVATPARQASNVTVSGNGASVSGSWNLTIPGNINFLAGAVSPGSLPGNVYDAEGDAAGNIYMATNAGVGKIPSATGAGMQAGTWYSLTPTAGEFIALNKLTGDVAFSVLGSPSIQVIAGSSGNRYGCGPMTTGVIYAVPGLGGVSSIKGVAFDGSGNLYINDSGNGLIRKVDQATGAVTTIAGGGGTAYYSGIPATTGPLGALFPGGTLRGLAADTAGNIFFADSTRVYARSAAGGPVLNTPTVAGQIYTVAGSAAAGNGGDLGPATSATFTNITDLAIAPAGDLLITDTGNYRVRLVSAAGGNCYDPTARASGTIYPLSGTGAPGWGGNAGPATSATMASLRGIGVDGSGNALIINGGNQLRRVWYGNSSVAGGLPYAAGTIDLVADGANAYGMALDVGDGAVASGATFVTPMGLAMDAAGNIAFADSNLGRVRYLPAAAGSFFGQAMTAGRIYTIAGDGNHRWNGENVSGRLASLNNPCALAFDGSGNLYIADGRVVRRLASNGIITTVAGNGTSGNSGDGGPATSAQLGSAEGVAVVGSTLYIADTGNNRIRQVDVALPPGIGTINALATGALSSPRGVMADSLGNLYIADSGNMRVQLYVVSAGTFHGQNMTAGNTYTAVTTPTSPLYAAVDSGRHVYYTDGSMVRMVSLAGFVFGLVGGTGVPAGNGGPASSATIGGANGIAVGPNGRVVFVGGNGADSRVCAIQ
jgi:sugar lactone lactonase YvrE